jgi:transposase
VDLLQDAGFRVHLAHPSGNDWRNRRVKNDERDARDLADLLRLGRLAEAWMAPPAVRAVRELVRYRAKLVQLRVGLKAQVHAVMGKEGVLPTLTDMFCPAGQRELHRMELGHVFVIRVESRRDLIEVYDREVGMLERKIHQLLRHDRGDQTIQALTGSGAPSPRSSSPRSATYTASAPRRRCARGRDWRLVIASPTPKSSAVRSPRWGHGSCVGPRSKPSPGTTGGPGPRTCGRRDVSAAEPALPHQPREPGADLASLTRADN